MAPIIGYGSTFAYSTNSGGSYTSVAEVTELGDPEVTVSDVKTSHLTTPSAAHTYIPGMVEGGEVSLKLLFEKPTVVALMALLRTANLWFKITYSDSGSTWVFQGHFKGLGGGGIPMDDKVEFPVKIKVSGLPVFTAGA